MISRRTQTGAALYITLFTLMVDITNTGKPFRKSSTFFRVPDLSITAIISPKTLEPFSCLQLWNQVTIFFKNITAINQTSSIQGTMELSDGKRKLSNHPNTVSSLKWSNQLVFKRPDSSSSASQLCWEEVLAYCMWVFLSIYSLLSSGITIG